MLKRTTRILPSNLVKQQVCFDSSGCGVQRLREERLQRCHPDLMSSFSVSFVQVRSRRSRALGRNTPDPLLELFVLDGSTSGLPCSELIQGPPLAFEPMKCANKCAVLSKYLS